MMHIDFVALLEKSFDWQLELCIGMYMAAMMRCAFDVHDLATVVSVRFSLLNFSRLQCPVMLQGLDISRLMTCAKFCTMWVCGCHTARSRNCVRMLLRQPGTLAAAAPVEQTASSIGRSPTHTLMTTSAIHDMPGGWRMARLTLLIVRSWN